jgi:DNA gyrase subunit A
MIKKTEFAAYNTPIQANGIIAIKINKGDELVDVRRTSGKDDIIMVSKAGYAARFDESKARPMGRGTAGVKGMNVAEKDNRVLAMDIARDDTEMFVVTENGYGKRTPIPDYPVKGRGTKGVQTIKLTTKKGGLAGAMIVRAHQDLVFISQQGMVQRTNVGGISTMGRATQGVRVMNMKAQDRVSAVALVVESAPDATNGGDPAAEVAEDGDGKAKIEPPEAAPKPKKVGAAESKPKAKAAAKTAKKPAAKPKAKKPAAKKSSRKK